MTAWILVRNETIKTTRRLAFWVAVLAYSGIVGLMLVGSHMNSVRAKDPRPFLLPDAWWNIIEEPAPLAAFFGASILVLLIASEFSWRTARQNVIDGLSREQWFLGKLLLLPMVAAVFFLIPLLAGPIVAMIGEGLPTNGWITATQVRFAGAVALCALAFASLALLFATTIRSTGSALAAFFLYIAFVERIVGMLLGLVREEWGRAAAFLPTRVFFALINPEQWSLPLRAALAKPGQPPAQYLDSTLLLGFTVGYIILFAGSAFLLFRKRDL